MKENDHNPLGAHNDSNSYPGFSPSERDAGSQPEAPSPMPDGAAYIQNPPGRASGSPSNDPYSHHKRVPAETGRERSAGRVVVFSVLVLILIVASAMFFGNMGGGVRDAGSFVIFGDRSESEKDFPTDEYSEDYRDYLYDYFSANSESGKYNIAQAALGTGVTLELLPPSVDSPLSLKQIYQNAIPSVCGITAFGDTEIDGGSWGTGIIISSDGYIITNAHVIDGASRVSVILNSGEDFEAKLAGADASSDIAVLKIEASGLSPAEFGDMESLAVGDEVVAIGNPLGEDFSGTMTNGIISAIDRDVVYQGSVLTLIQTNAALNEGNSGGPLINMYGQVIGITNMKMVSYYSTIEGIGFAIPVKLAKPVVDTLIESGKISLSSEPAIGIVCGSIPDAARSYYSLPGGVFVSEVIKNSDAYKKGIRVGDIITEINGEPVNAISNVAKIKNELAIGDVIVLRVFRDNETFVTEVSLMDRSLLFSD